MPQKKIGNNAVWVATNETPRTFDAIRAITSGPATIALAYRIPRYELWQETFGAAGHTILQLEEAKISCMLPVVRERLMAIGMVDRREILIGGSRRPESFPPNLIHARLDTEGPEIFGLCVLALLADEGFMVFVTLKDPPLGIERWRSLAQLIVPDRSMFIVS